LLRGLCLGVLDLLEHLAHAGPHQIAGCGIGIAIPAAGTRRLSAIEIGRLVVTGLIRVRHGPIVGPRAAAVNALG